MASSTSERLRSTAAGAGADDPHKDTVLPDWFMAVVIYGLMLVFLPFLSFFWIVGDLILHFCMGRTWLYNMSWEDPRMDMRELECNEEDHVLTIASAGDNAFEYVVEGCKVTAVDVNSAQLALCELKMVAATVLSHEDFFAIFGHDDMSRLRAVYRENLRPMLTPQSREFWDSNVSGLRSIMYSGTSGFLAWVIKTMLFPCLGGGKLVQAIGEGDEEGVKRWTASTQRMSWLWQMLRVLDQPFVLNTCAILAGVPWRQLQCGKHRNDSLRQVVAKLLRNDIHNNYFIVGYLGGKFREDCCPRYMLPEFYAKLQKNLRQGHLRLLHKSMENAAREHNVEDPNAFGPYTVLSLLDHLDWMAPSCVHRELAAMLAKTDQSKGRVFWRSFADDPHTMSLALLRPHKVDDSDDRVPMYFSTWSANVSEVDSCPQFELLDHASWGAQELTPSQRLFRMASTGLRIVIAPVMRMLMMPSREKDSEHKGKMEMFYEAQKNDYDLFRESMLHARKPMIQLMPLLTGAEKDMVWVDIGGGTARNLEFMPIPLLRRFFRRIVVLDISPSLLEIATARIRQHGLEDLIKVVEADVTAPGLLETHPVLSSLRHESQIVTFSYSLSMIPDQRGALAFARELLHPTKGFLGIADFTCHFASEEKGSATPPCLPPHRAIESALHRAWFAQDHVHLLRVPHVHEMSQLRCVCDERMRGGVPFLPLLKPVHLLLWYSTDTSIVTPETRSTTLTAR